jgi:hypothetical protein
VLTLQIRPRVENSRSSSPEGFGKSHSAPFSGLVVDAIQFWETRRLLYNLVLCVVAIAWLTATWPHFRHAFTPSLLSSLAVLAVFANACYCAAYIFDIPMQTSSLSSVWKRWRGGFWLIGTLFAVVLANYWIADEIYPFVR